MDQKRRWDLWRKDPAILVTGSQFSLTELVSSGLVLLQRHAAFAGSSYVRESVTGTTASAIAEKQPAAGQTDLFEGLAATTFGRVDRILFTGTAFGASANQCHTALDLDHMPPLHRLAAFAIPRSGTHRITGATVTAGTAVNNVGPLTLTGGLRLRRSPRLRHTAKGEQQKQCG
jgi:hypothetical protein